MLAREREVHAGREDARAVSLESVGEDSHDVVVAVAA
jgi:hypothetical protein